MVSRRRKTPELQEFEASIADMSAELRAVYERMHAREMTFRQELFERYPTYLVNEVPDRSGNTTSTSLVRKWLRERRCFAYCHAGRYRFPTYQFDRGAPKPVIRRVIGLLYPLDGWVVMYWFVSANAWLDAGASPLTMLDSDPQAVLVAASHANDLTSD
jgi:hypothetical protein